MGNTSNQDRLTDDITSLIDSKCPEWDFVPRDLGFKSDILNSLSDV